ncbi:hypothetical protein QAD02_021937 [Eretmocerus hayati]|uniref:Uncharacterized protein n=1 Tax=Eretmocerus hayati TaxID=131215 RepID=A0ACC2PT31_9HYME|nr:hypothetical protein QAD02_021937 [Eretmocerus hayati]
MWSQKLTHCDPWISSSAVAADDSYALPFQDNFYVDPGFGIRDLNATPTVLYNEETSHRRSDQYKNHVDGNADYLPDNGERNYRNVTSVIEMEVCLDAPLVKAYSSKLPLSVEKQKDIKTMMDKLTIPGKYHEYYAELLK